MHGGISAVAEADNVEIQNSGATQHLSTAIERGTRREDIVNEDIMLPESKGSARSQCKGIFEVRHPGSAIECRLAFGIDGPDKQ
jgi:hypothetical protein